MAMLTAVATAYVVGIYAALEVSTRVWIGIALFFVLLIVFSFILVWIRNRLIWRKIKSGKCSPEEADRLLDVVTSGAYSRVKESTEYKAAEARARREREVYLDPLLEKIESKLDREGKTLSVEEKRILDSDLKELEKRLQWMNKK